ncbi:uncharacterized protein LOC129582869 [Paramacrobiotus metropolitanus]|uniref:uncharacterized protein LOC129582869 n=1 Tax=Paramacrobiotus metropolitanus TaxID=2943436 RepID=UPI0024461E72|nr:uncharacterized protein LOC129582869 [Paramacrobiotus metropolitanus]
MVAEFVENNETADSLVAESIEFVPLLADISNFFVEHYFLHFEIKVCLDEKVPWTSISRSSGAIIEEMYKRLENLNKKRTDAVKLKSEHENASDARCLQLVLESKCTEWDQMESEEGKQTYFNSCRSFFNNCSATREQIEERLAGLAEVLNDYHKEGFHHKYKDIVAEYFGYFKDMYLSYKIEMPEVLQYPDTNDRIPLKAQISPIQVRRVRAAEHMPPAPSVFMHLRGTSSTEPAVSLPEESKGTENTTERLVITTAVIPFRPPKRRHYCAPFIDPNQIASLKANKRNAYKDGTTTVDPVSSQDKLKQPDFKKRKVEPQGEEACARNALPTALQPVPLGKPSFGRPSRGHRNGRSVKDFGSHPQVSTTSQIRAPLPASVPHPIVVATNGQSGVELGKLVVNIIAFKPAQLRIRSLNDVQYLINYADHPQEFVPHTVCIHHIPVHVAEYLAQTPIMWLQPD